MRQFDAANHLNDLVYRRIDHVDCVASAVCDVHARSGAGWNFWRSFYLGRSYPVGHGDPVRILIGSKLPPTGMEGIATRFRRQRVKQKAAGFRFPGCDQELNACKVLPRLFFAPIRGAGR